MKNISDSSLPVGRKEVIQQGRTGYRVNTYKSVIKNGKVVSRDLITRDYYKPREFIYRVGTKPVSSPSKQRTDKNKGNNENDKSGNKKDSGNGKKNGEDGTEGSNGNDGNEQNGSDGEFEGDED